MLLIIILASILIFARAIHGEFLFDDPAIVDMGLEDGNGRILTLAQLRYPRSMTHLGYWVTWRLAGFNPRVWHSVNLAIHAANVALVFLLADSIFTTANAALIAAAVFAIHPLQTSSVCYISGRSGLQSALFTLAGLIIFQHGNPALYPIAAISQFFAWKSKQDSLLFLAFYLILAAF